MQESLLTLKLQRSQFSKGGLTSQGTDDGSVTTPCKKKSSHSCEGENTEELTNTKMTQEPTECPPSMASPNAQLHIVIPSERDPETS